MTDVLDQLSTHLENVRPMLQPLYERSSQLAGLIHDTGETQKISRYLFRIPLKKFAGGSFAKVSGNNGAMPLGHSGSTTHLTSGYFISMFSFRLTQEQIDTTQGGQQSIYDVLEDSLDEAIEGQQVHDDIALHTDGTGKLTNGASAVSAGSTSTMTFAAATDRVGINRLREGMSVEVWNNAGSTKRSTVSGNVPIIIAINYTTKVVTLNENISGLSASGGGDILTFAGLDAYGPSTLASFQSSWPTAPASQVAAGLSGDSFRHGMYYYNDATAANYVLGVQKSALPQLLPAYVSASGALNFSHGLKIYNNLQQRRSGEGMNALAGLLGVVHMKQREQIFNIGVAIANKDVEGNKFGSSLDLLPANHNYTDKVDFAGIVCTVDKRQNEDRLDYINPQKWGRSQLKELDYWGADMGRKFFEGRNGDGRPTLSWEWSLMCSFDYYNVDPGCQGYIDGLSIPS